MKTPIWDKCKTLTSIHKHERGKPQIPFRLVKPGMTATASISGKNVDILISSEISPNLFEGVVKWVDSRNTTTIDIIVNDVVSIPLDKISHLNQDIR